MKKLVLIHETDTSYLPSIFKSKALLPASKTHNKNQNPLDKDLPHIFFNACPDKHIKYLIASPILIFPIDILYNKTFYTNDRHSAGNLKTSTKYTKNTSKKIIYNSLLELFNKSLKISKEIKMLSAFTAFQEVFLKGKISLNDAIGIIIRKTDETLPYINFIKKEYPNMKIHYMKELNKK